MGRVFEAECVACHNTFRADEGGGALFQGVGCDLCGKREGVMYEDIWDTYLAMLKGLHTGMPELNGADWRTYAGDPITKEEYRRRVEHRAGMCACGGKFLIDAPIRCPECGSDSVTDQGTIMLYD